MYFIAFAIISQYYSDIISIKLCAIIAIAIIKKGDLKMTIGEKIRYIRTSKKLSAEKLAKSAGLGQSTISEIELGKKSPTIVTLEKICSALNITLVELFSSDSESKSKNINPQLKELLHNAKDLTPEQLELLSKFIKSIK